MLEPSMVMLPVSLDITGAGVLAAVVLVPAGLVVPVVVVGVSVPPPQDAKVAANVMPATKVTTLRLIFFFDIIKTYCDYICYG